MSSPSSGYNSSGTGGSQEDEGRQEEEERLLIDLSRYFIISIKGALRRPVTYDNHPIPSHPRIVLKTISHELRLIEMF